MEVQVEALARAQSDTGQTVHVVTGTPDRGPGADVSFPFAVHRVRASELRGLLTSLRPDAVHIHVSVVSPFAWRAARITGELSVPAVLTVHSMWDSPVRLLYRTIAALGRWRRGLVVTAVSTPVGRQVAKALPGSVRIMVVPNGVDTGRWTVDAAQRTRGGAEFHVVSVGRLARRRQPMALLRVLRESHARLSPGVGMRATIVGAGPRRSAMKRYLRRHRMDGWVDLVGAHDRAGVHRVLSTADAYLNVTGREAFGLAVLEARCAGLPVVARSTTGVADFIEHGREGLLGRRLEDLVDQLTRIGRDGLLRERIAEHNRSTRPTTCSWPFVLERLQDCYDQAAELAWTRADDQPRTDKETRWRPLSTSPASPGATSYTCASGSPTALPPASPMTSSAQRG
ncbi:glycosyltransferase family 4 protein [Streptomyces roseirectus]|uniref:Glycosyltransferase family 4 protein n=1 Tax=Streptomyces roseirectus TaxID=2768066 RepID=A0A7H0ITE1_9ACTN|nr:glycosyltransferase family 4 protein [Streptomyces roseirectus]